MSRRESLRTTNPAPRSAPPPATSRTTSSPVKGSVAEDVVAVVEPTEEQVCGLYPWQVELLEPNAAVGTDNARRSPTSAEMRFMNPFVRREAEEQ